MQGRGATLLAAHGVRRAAGDDSGLVLRQPLLDDTDKGLAQPVGHCIASVPLQLLPAAC